MHRPSLRREALFDTLVEEVTSPAEGEPLRHLDVQALASDLFGAGAKTETLYRNRTALYEVSGALERAASRRQKKLAKTAAADATGEWCQRPAYSEWDAADAVPLPSPRDMSRSKCAPVCCLRCDMRKPR